MSKRGGSWLLTVVELRAPEMPPPPPHPLAHKEAISKAVRTGTFPTPPYSSFRTLCHCIIRELMEEVMLQKEAPATIPLRSVHHDIRVNIMLIRSWERAGRGNTSKPPTGSCPRSTMTWLQEPELPGLVDGLEFATTHGGMSVESNKQTLLKRTTDSSQTLIVIFRKVWTSVCHFQQWFKMHNVSLITLKGTKRNNAAGQGMDKIRLFFLRVT